MVDAHSNDAIYQELREIKADLKCLSKNFQDFLVQNTRELSAANHMARDALEKAKTNERNISKLTDQVSTIMPWIKVIAAIGGIILAYLTTQVLTSLF